MADLTTSVGAAMATPSTTPEAKTSTPVEAPKAVDKTPKASEPPKDATPAEKKLWKLKVDGQEMEVDEEELKRGYAHNKAANKRLEEAAATRKQAEEAFAMLKDPAKLRQLLEDPRIGVDARKFAEEYLWEKLQEDALTPEQKSQRAVQRELEKYKAAEQAAKEQAETSEGEALQAKYAEQYEQTILTALDQTGIPKTRAAVRRMAQYLQMAVANDMDISPADIAARVKQDIQDEHREMYGSGDANALVSILGEDLAKKLREADLKRLKSTQPQANRRPPSNAKPVGQKDKPKQRISADNIAAMLTEKLKG